MSDIEKRKATPEDIENFNRSWRNFVESLPKGSDGKPLRPSRPKYDWRNRIKNPEDFQECFEAAVYDGLSSEDAFAEAERISGQTIRGDRAKKIKALRNKIGWAANRHIHEERADQRPLTRNTEPKA